MDWIKVKTSHVLYDYADMTDSEFRAWIKYMCLVATMEKEPSNNIILKNIHHKTFLTLKTTLTHHHTPLQDIVKKVLEDVNRVVKHRVNGKARQDKFRHKIEESNGLHNGLRNGLVTQQDKIREDKIREEYIIPPSLEAVRLYCQSRKNNINPESFVNFYQARGWMAGKNKMKDWQAAIRTWEQRDKPKRQEMNTL